MKLTVKCVETNSEKVFDVAENESAIWKAIGEELMNLPCPATVDAETENGDAAHITVKERGTWTDDDGEVHPSRFITTSGGSLAKAYPAGTYSPCYLACIHPMSNNYKAYYLEQRADGLITARYNSIDAFMQGDYREVKTPYASYLYWIRYYEKLSKGYVDQSDIYFGTVKKKQKVDAVPKLGAAKPSKRTASEELYEMLLRFAKNRVSSSLVSNHVTERQVKKARAIWKKLCNYKTVKAFNRHLQELLMISPRRRDPLHGDSVLSFLANTAADFSKIIDREENLILAMEALVGVEEQEQKTDILSFKNFGVEVFEASQEQRKEVLDLLGTSLVGRVKRIWRVKPLAQEKKFAAYCKARGIKKIRKLWHGSRNENWASIIKNGLLLNPNAVITGKMFGAGIYFAPSPSKSFNYTSCNGTYWAHGTSDRGFMGVYATAYGNPRMVTTWGGDYSSECKSKAYDCVHATSSNTGLRADEIVFYDESAMVLNYLVEFC